MDKIDAGARAQPAEQTIIGETDGGRFDAWRVTRTALGDMVRAPRLGWRGLVAALGVVLLAWLSTSLYRVEPDEKGVVLRFGQWVATTDPGLHAHWPYPIETVLLPKVTEINQIQIGVGPSAGAGPGEPSRGGQMLTGDENPRGLDLHLHLGVDILAASTMNFSTVFLPSGEGDDDVLKDNASRKRRSSRDSMISSPADRLPMRMPLMVPQSSSTTTTS